MLPSSDRLSDYLHYFFRAYLPGHRGASPHTVASYRQTFLHLLRFYRSRCPDDPHPAVERFQVPLLLDFLSHLEQQRGNSASTRNLRLAALKSFFAMVALLQPRYQALSRQIRSIPPKRVVRPPRDYLDKPEVDAVFASIPCHSRQGFRDLCLLRTLYNTGARASELCSIRLPDLRLAERNLLLYGKGGKLRTLPLWQSTLAFLRRYLHSERPPARAGFQDFLFLNQRRTALTRSGLYQLCRRYLEQARQQLPSLRAKRIHPVHGWRYTTATHLLLAGVDVTVIQDWLGHASINTTCRYKGVSVQVKREALQKFYLFEKSWHQTAPQGVDWKLYPDLLAYLESL